MNLFHNCLQLPHCLLFIQVGKAFLNLQFFDIPSYTSIIVSYTIIVGTFFLHIVVPLITSSFYIIVAGELLNTW